MAGYRFCRPDDIPLLVKAINSTYSVHFPAEPECTISSFKADVSELNLWTSSCMIAIEGDLIIGVCIGCKREQETLIYKIGVHPDYLRSGHGSHLLNSLRKKLSVLGPPTIVAEVSKQLAGTCDFFRKLGFDQVGSLYDYELTTKIPETTHHDLLAEISFSDVERSKLLAPISCSWLRATETLENAKSRLKGVAVVAPERVEAYLLFTIDELSKLLKILRIWSSNSPRQEPLFRLLLSALSKYQAKTVVIPRVSAEEIRDEMLENTGFLKTTEYVRFKASSPVLPERD